VGEEGAPRGAPFFSSGNRRQPPQTVAGVLARWQAVAMPLRISRLILPCLVGVAMIGGRTEAAPSPTRITPMEETVATGSFDVTLTPVSTPDAPVGAMTISKAFHGELNGTSAGQMLAVRTPVEGSAGYVAMERVTATLAGHKGTFALQHSGSMNRGAQSLSVTVVPDSGTEGLAGLKGSMDIKVEGGKHFYTFRYSLP
jgi:hypothetical protein